MIIMSLDVLSVPSPVSEDVGARQPTSEGRKLWNTLFPAYSGRMMVFAHGVENQEGLLNWLKREGFKASTVDFIAENSVEAKVERISNLHAVYGKINWYIDVDPKVVARVAHNGTPTLLVTVPHTVRPEWSESRFKKEWGEIVEETDKQALARAERNWGDV